MRTSLAVIGISIVLGMFVAAGLWRPETPAVTASREARPASPEPSPAAQPEPGPPSAPTEPGAPSTPRQLFPPEDLPLLEGPDRELWQKPELVMDTLRIAEGSKVADIGAGAGWFTIRLARRVEQNGTVYAQDVQREMYIAISRRVKRERLGNVKVILGSEDLPNLPQKVLDAVLAVDVYPEVSDRVTFLRSLAAALKPTGRIGIVNYKPGKGGPGPDSRVDSDSVIADAKKAGLHMLQPPLDLRYQYMIVLGP